MVIAAPDKRAIRVTEGNIRNSSISVAGLYSFFPPDCYGEPSKGKGAGKPIRILLDGLDRTIETDIGREAKTGKPRRQFRARKWVKEFFRHHDVRAGDLLELQRVDTREYVMRLVSHPTMRAVEFFAGIGLVRLALERQGFRVVFANDIDPNKFEIYRANFAEDDFLLGDIHELSEDQIPDCELVTASFPCTDLSIAGEMKGLNSGESSAFWGLIRILKDMDARRPQLVLLENVPGFLMSHGGRDFESALLAMNELGYAVDAFFLDAACFVPQSRLRLFVVGKQAPSGQSVFGLTASALRPETLVQFMNAHPEITWDIHDLPPPPAREVSLESILEDLPDDHPAWWNQERSAYFMNQLSERHLAVADKMIQQRVISFGTAFRRVRNCRSMAELRTDGVAGCLRTPKGGSGRQILFKAGKGRYQVRLLTARECARLQGVPDSYVVPVPLNQALFGFGDAVCVPAIEWIAKQYLAPLGSKLPDQVEAYR
ncbi:MAG: DNA (cytosine-5-)-methyltransferase [Planctomycetaceae bacterium]|nr:DNA cytosine methyltransferase [Planctomycetaceae bacterium]